MIIPTGYAQANIFYAGTVVPTGAENTLGLQVGVPGPTPAEVAESVAGLWEITVMPFLVDNISMTHVAVKFGPGDTGPSGEFPLVVAGGDTGEGDAPSVAVLVKKNTVDGGRAGRGRMYLPGIRESRVEDGGHINGTYAEDLAEGLENFRLGLISDDINPVVLHGPDSPIATPSEIVTFTVDPTAATQRRRMRR